MAPRPGSIRAEAAARGVTVYQIRVERGAARGLSRDVAVGKGRGGVTGPRQIARALAAVLAPATAPIVTGRDYVRSLGINPPPDSGGPFSLVVGNLVVDGLGRAGFLRLYNQLRDRGIDFESRYTG